MAKIVEGNGGEVHAREDDGGEEQRNQRDGPHLEILFRHGGK
ncbi:hypothetical protein [Paraburkholderia ginsengiterrae]|nr:hypothetical protein [Paraburkholderia ginsengiterrae]